MKELIQFNHAMACISMIFGVVLDRCYYFASCKTIIKIFPTVGVRSLGFPVFLAYALNGE